MLSLTTITAMQILASLPPFSLIRISIPHITNALWIVRLGTISA